MESGAREEYAEIHHPTPCPWLVLSSWHWFVAKYLSRGPLIPGTVWARAGGADSQEEGEEEKVLVTGQGEPGLSRGGASAPLSHPRLSQGLIPWKEPDRDARHPQGPLPTTVFLSKDTELPGDCVSPWWGQPERTILPTFQR